MSYVGDNTIYLGMDGVIFDFVSAAIEVCDLPLRHNDVADLRFYRPYMTADEFWSCIRGYTSFWEDLPLYPWARDLIELANQHGHVKFCSDPSKDDESATGKIRALKRHGLLASGRENYVLCRDKWALARPKTLLIDDVRAVCADFCFFSKEASAIIFPQLWNEGVNFVDDRLGYVLRSLTAWSDEVSRDYVRVSR
jgi:hypothetical protein